MHLTRTVRAAALAALLAAAALATGGSATAAGQDDVGAEFTACMRAHGLPDFPLATVSADGRIDLDPSGAGIDPFSETYRTALAACAPLLPAGTALPAEPDPPAAPPAVLVPEVPGCDAWCPPAPAPPTPAQPSTPG